MKDVPLRLAATAVAITAFALVPAAPGRVSQRAPGAARAGAPLAAREPGPDGRGRPRPPDRRVVFALNARLPLRPASNEKLATTYAALTALGPSFRIETDVLGEGQQNGTTWQGDIVLKGYGDPTLSYARAVVARAPGGG